MKFRSSARGVDWRLWFVSFTDDRRRAALLSRAIDILAERGVQALTFRAVTRAAGVSQTAPYRYFTDRQAFLAAVAAEGRRLLIHRMREREAADLPSFQWMAWTYVDFALTNPGLYELMFSAGVSGEPSRRDLVEFLSARIRAVQRSEAAGQGDPAAMAVAFWATLHGVVRVALDGLSEGLEVAVHDVSEAATRMMVQGIARRAEPVPDRRLSPERDLPTPPIP